MNKIESVKIDVLGMSCASCSQSVQRVLNNSEGVLKADVSIASNTAQIEYDADKTNLSLLKATVEDIGFELLIDKLEIEAKEKKLAIERNILKRKLIVGAVFSIPLATISMAYHSHSFASAFILFLLSLPVIFYSGSHFFTRAWKQVLKGVFTMDALVSLGVGSAFIFSSINLFFPHFLNEHTHSYQVYFESAAIIICLVLLGKNLEERTKRKANESIKLLLNLQAKKSAHHNRRRRN